jgi:hypothetical protein
MACTDCNDVDINTGADGYNGWSPIYANIEETCDGTDVVIQQLISWTGGTGTKPEYSGSIMTDTWLATNPIYLGSTGFVTTICNATNILGATGAAGGTGSEGEAGPAGEAGNDGCNPDISVSASVVGGDKTYEVDVTRLDDPLTPCFPEYYFEFPIDIFTDTVENLISTALVAEEFAEDLTSIGTSSGPQVYLTSVFGPGSGDLDFWVDPGNYSSFTQLYKVGKTVTFNFRLGLINNTGSIYTANQILIKFPTAFTDRPSNSSQYSAVGMYRASASSANNLDPQVDKQAIITTNSLDNDYLAIRYEPAGFNYPVLILGDSDTISILGQITFNIT